ncbi:MAG TPA: tetratricopeptide repeat protein [Burkholderiales bacterium]|nr:tetratricopeptide repeat protein [Burkholderiales bacterium]
MSASLEVFAELVRRDDAKIDLARCCLLIAEDAYPGLDVEHYLAELERLALRLRAGLPQTAGAEERVMALNQFLFDELGYRGNVDEYYDPRNSYLNEVMERKTGIPITLAILYMELGRRIGLPLEGVSFPGHFLVRLRLRGGMLVLDPFGGGAPQSESELYERLKRVIPEGSAGGVPVGELPLDQFLEPATHRQILARVLRNLKGIYRDTDKPERLLEVLNRILVLNPQARAELRDRGLLYQRMEAYRAAFRDLSEYLEREPDAPEFEEIRARVMDLRTLCGRLN